MKTANKLLAILLAMLMVIGCVSLTAFADPEDEEEWDCSTLGHEFVDGECIHCYEPDPDWEDPGEEWDCSTLGHEFVDGECIHCFEPDPDWESDEEWDCSTMGHDFEGGACIYCREPDPDWDCSLSGHVFEDGFCIVCGETDPDWNECSVNGHDYDNGVCINCGKEDPALNPVVLSLGDNQVHVFGYSVDYIVCSFTPSESGWYLFTSSNADDSDPSAESVSDGTIYDDYGGNMDFRFYANLTADSAYLLRVWDNCAESDIVISIAATDEPDFPTAELSLGDNELQYDYVNSDRIVCNFTAAIAGTYLFSTHCDNEDPYGIFSDCNIDDNYTFNENTCNFIYEADLEADETFSFSVMDRNGAASVIINVELVYVVTLDPGEGSGEPIVYRSSDQTEFPNWENSENLHFYLEDDGRMGFRLNSGYCPDTFIAPENYVFDKWSEDYTFHTLSSTNTVITALWKEDATLLEPAYYSLSPSEYTIENSGYTDITCSFDSLYLGSVTNKYGNVEKAQFIGFIINGGTLTDGNGSSIPFLVDDWFHSDAEDRKSTGNGYSSQEETFIMSVWIDPEDYAAAAPGTYTGELVYDSVWNARGDVAGESGSIALTLVIPEPETEPSFSFAPSEAVLTGAGYNDIDCTVSSVTFGTVTDYNGEQFMPDSLKFRFESSYVKDGKGHYISVYAGAQTHNGTADLYTLPVMPDGTVDLALFINQDSYDAAPVGLYTGKVKYTCIWTDIAGHHSEGETGEIALTLVIPDTAVTASISANEVVRGDKLTWNITTQADVTWLKFNGTDENGNAYTSYYKYSNYNKGTTEASVTDTEDGRVWNIPMVFNYAGTQAVDNQTWTIEYRVSGSNEWKSAPGEPFNIKVGKNAAALAPAPAEGEFAPYSIIAAVSEDREENGAEYKYFYITTTDDVSKVKISFINDDTGKTKSATYQTTSTNVVDLDTANGFSVWTIRMKVTAQAQDNAYTVQVRGPAWGEGVVATESEMIG